MSIALLKNSTPRRNIERMRYSFFRAQTISLHLLGSNLSLYIICDVLDADIHSYISTTDLHFVRGDKLD